VFTWPRGRSNGQRVAGVSIKVNVDLLRWTWLPVVHWRYAGCVWWLCFWVWINWEYEPRKVRTWTRSQGEFIRVAVDAGEGGWQTIRPMTRNDARQLNGAADGRGEGPEAGGHPSQTAP